MEIFKNTINVKQSVKFDDAGKNFSFFVMLK